MIKTNLNREDAEALIKVGETFMKESRFGNHAYNPEKVWAVLDQTIVNPHRFFIAYDDQFQGLFLLAMSRHYFSDDLFAGDLAFYVTPEKRGSSLAYRLFKAGEEWARKEGAKELTIMHNTGIGYEGEQSNFYTKLGFTDVGRIYTKEL
jgi:GNAT superfamily N-acetyltransferase